MLNISESVFVKKSKTAVLGKNDGFYKKYKNRIVFFDKSGEIFAAIICNQNFVGLVNAREINGKVYYQYAASSQNEKLFGIPEKYSEQSEYVKNIFMGVE